MTDEEYQQTQHTLMIVGDVLRDLDLSEFLHRIKVSEAMGPILDPTLYMQAHKRLACISRLAKAGIRFQAAFAELQEQLEAEGGGPRSEDEGRKKRGVRDD